MTRDSTTARASRWTAPWITLAFVLGCCATAVYAWCVFVPLIPDTVYANADWLWAFSLVHDKGLALGRDIMFTYGPLGYVMGSYYPTTFPILVLAWTFFAGAIWTALFVGMRRRGISRAWTVIGLAAFFVLAAGEYIPILDCRPYLLIACLLMYHFCIDDRPSSAVKLVLFAALGLTGLIKFTFLVTGALICGIVGVDEILRRRLPVGALVYIGVYLIGWRLTGQAYSNLPAYFSSSIEVVRGYTEAMTLWSPTELTDVLLYSLPALLLCALVWMAGAEQPARRRALFVLGLFVLLYLVFKAGFVRHDNHEVFTTSFLPLVILMFGMLNYPRLRRGLLAGMWIICLLPALYAASRSYQRCATQDLFARMYESFPRAGEELVDSARILAGQPSKISQMFVACLRESADSAPLPKVDGPTNILMTWPYRVIANGLDYLPSPTIQSYSAYTPRLAQADAAYLHSDRGPTNVFFAFDQLDIRFPAISDGPAMLELLSRFDRIGSTGMYLQFRRSTSPRTVRMSPLAHLAGQWNQEIHVPAIDGKIVWAVIDMKQTMFGKLASAVFKPPMIYITMTLRNGQRTDTSRFVPGCARAGFIISPVLYDLDSFSNLCMPPRATAHAPIYPYSFHLGDRYETAPRRSYQPTFDVQFFEVDFSADDGEGR